MNCAVVPSAKSVKKQKSTPFAVIQIECRFQDGCYWRPTIQMHRGIGLVEIVAVVLVELGRLVRNFAGSFALVAVFQPQQIQGDTAALEFLVDIGVVRHLVDRLRGAGRKQTL